MEKVLNSQIELKFCLWDQYITLYLLLWNYRFWFSAPSGWSKSHLLKLNLNFGSDISGSPCIDLCQNFRFLLAAPGGWSKSQLLRVNLNFGTEISGSPSIDWCENFRYWLGKPVGWSKSQILIVSAYFASEINRSPSIDWLKNVWFWLGALGGGQNLNFSDWLKLCQWDQHITLYRLMWKL